MGRVLYVNLSAVHGGAEECLLDHMLAARELGHEPLLLLPELGWLSDRCRDHEIAFRVVGTLPETFRTPSAWRQAAPMALNNARVAVTALRRRPLAVICNSPRAAYHAGPAARALRLPCLVWVHEMRRLPYGGARRGRLLSAVSDLTVAVSAAVRDAVLAGAPQLGERTEVVRNGVDPARYALVAPAELAAVDADLERPVLGYVGGVTPAKGLHVALEAVRRLADRGRSLTFLVVGDPQGDPQQEAYARGLRDFVERHRLQRRVRFVGWREDAWSVIKALDLLVHPPVEPDSQPRVVIHAMGLGTPVVASGIGGIPEQLDSGACGVLVPPGDAEALATAVTGLLDDEARRLALTDRARARQRSLFSQQQFRDGLERVYRRLLPAVS